MVGTRKTVEWKVMPRANVGQGEVSPAFCAADLAITAPISRLFHGLVAVYEFPLRLATAGSHGGLLIA